jgi:hypothetical protein
MRWESLFDDLAGQLAAESAADFEAEVQELARMEAAAITVMDRFRASTGRTVVLGLAGAARLTGELLRCGDDWLLLRDGPRSVLVPLAAIRWTSGAAPTAVPLRGGAPFPLTSALRGLARDRAAVLVSTRESGAAGLAGVIDAVGRDYLQLALVPAGEPRRTSAVQESRLLPLAALASVSSVLPESG